MYPRTGVVGRATLLNECKYMAKAFGGALSLALMLLVLRLALPEVGTLLVQIIIKILLLISKIVDHAGTLPPLQ